ncbi:MAG: gfo/Idh/MocA family oxidoreductase, partial [Actinomycetota bacterium]|nr:gfo/Idh/MocA family oxidoreductase [Actinomycetota bacterium]
SQSRRYSPEISAFRDALAELGGAAQLHADFFQNPRFGGFRDEMAHPLLIDMAIHAFDQARFVLGVDPVSVFCDEFNPPWSWYVSGASATAVFTFEQGQRFTYVGSWCADGLTTSWNAGWRGVAPEGSAIWDGERAVEFERRAGGRTSVPVSSAREGIVASLDEFLAFLDGGPTASGEVHSNIWSLAMVEAAVMSAESGERVDFTDVFSRAHEVAVSGGEPDVIAVIASWPAAHPPRLSP